MKVEITRDAERLEELIGDWDDLSLDVAEPNVFYDSWMLLPALRYLATGREQVLLFWEGERLAGLVPIDEEVEQRQFPVRRIRFWKHKHCFTCTPLFRRGLEKACALALLGWLDDQIAPTILLGDYLTADSMAYVCLSQVLSELGRVSEIVDTHRRPFLSRSLGYAEYMQEHHNAKTRNSVKRSARRLAELGTLELSFFHEDSDDVDQCLGEFIGLEARGWKYRDGGAIACDARVEEYVRSIGRAAAARGCLLMPMCRLDKRLVSSVINFRSGPGAFVYKPTYDEELGKYSPGVHSFLGLTESVLAGDYPAISWIDSCTAANGPMFSRYWKEARTILKIRIASDHVMARSYLRLLRAGRTARSRVRGLRGRSSSA